MFVRVHSNKEVRGGNTGSCFALVNYLSKEGGDFFSHTQGDSFDMFQVMNQIDNNKSKLGSEDAKFYMLSINPSQEELFHLLGRQVKSNEELTEEDRQTLSEKLQDYTRSCMDEYARSFGRGGIRGGEDLLYYAKIETERRYKFDDREVQMGRAKIDALKEGLNWHVHVIVSRKSKDGTTKLSPTVKSRGNEWINGEGREMKRGFNHTLWKQNCAAQFATQYGYKFGTKEVVPKVNNSREIALRNIYSKELRELLTSKSFPSVRALNRVVENAGWTVTKEEGKRIYTKGKETCYITEYRLQSFVAPISSDTIRSISSRLDIFEVRGNKDECGHGLQMNEYTYTYHGVEKRYMTVYDIQRDVEVSLGKIFRYSKGEWENIISKIEHAPIREGLKQSRSMGQFIDTMKQRGYKVASQDRTFISFERAGGNYILRVDPIQAFVAHNKNMQNKIHDTKSHNRYSSAPQSHLVSSKINRSIQKGVKGSIDSKGLEEVHTMKHVSYKTKQAIQMIINPKIALKNIVLSSVRNILGGGKEL